MGRVCQKPGFGITISRTSKDRSGQFLRPLRQGSVWSVFSSSRRRNAFNSVFELCTPTSAYLERFHLLEEYKIKELSDVFDAFKLHHQHAGPTTIGGTNPAGVANATGVGNSVGSAAANAASATAVQTQMAALMASQQFAAAATSSTAAAAASSMSQTQQAELMAAMEQYQQRLLLHQKMANNM